MDTTGRMRFAVIGEGNRGQGLSDLLLIMKDVQIVAACDVYEDRVAKLQKKVVDHGDPEPFGTTDYHDILAMKDKVDAVLISTSWETHVPIAIDTLKAGIPTALEVCGSYSIESLWDLVHTEEATKTPFMFMENCCFGKAELLATSLVRNGVLGSVVQCDGCYGHYLTPNEILHGVENRHYRLRNYIGRNCENYPTHELGPIAKLLNINRGNQFVSLVSVASRAEGLADYVRRHPDEYPSLINTRFQQGDIVNTIITCADGSTISMRLDTTLPRYYSRGLTVHATKGLFEQSPYLICLEGDRENEEFLRENVGNAEKYEAEYLPEVWTKMSQEAIEAGHGGIDYIEFRVFVDTLRAGGELPIDVYDAAAWMCITTLSEKSIAMGGAPQAIPDFTSGMWTVRPSRDVVKIPVVKK